MKTIPIFNYILRQLPRNHVEKRLHARLMASKPNPTNHQESSKPTERPWNNKDSPDLADFILANSKHAHAPPPIPQQKHHPYLRESYGQERKVYFDVYGCQMNVNDIEIVWSILKKNNYQRTEVLAEADVVLVMTCAIREGAEAKIWSRLHVLNSLKQRKQMIGAIPMKIGLLGCMAERLKGEILSKNKTVDLVAGPDAYRDLPRLLSLVEDRQTAINVVLSADETYADIRPVRLNQDSVSAYVSIMRGCDNMCTYCIVPFVRGRERSRPVSSILDDVRQLADQGIKEITLLGQNVNSYRDTSEVCVPLTEKPTTKMADGFKTVYKSKLGGLRFSDLLEKVSAVDPEIRIRFTSPHPKDFPDEVLHLIASRSNICNQIHLPAQSGNSDVLERMRRGYTREAYLKLVDHIRSIIPDVKLSSDFIAGFCGETDEEFEDTITLMDTVKYHMAYLFLYSMREKTTAHRRFKDDVLLEVKHKRVERMTELFRSHAEKLNRMLVGTQQLVLIEGASKRTSSMLQGRCDGNIRVIIPNSAIAGDSQTDEPKIIKRGDYIVAQICAANSHSLRGIPLYHSSISEFSCETSKQNQQETVREAAYQALEYKSAL